MPIVKVELHSHTWDDPDDVIDHSPRHLIEHAVLLGYGALAITLHDWYFDDPKVTADAAALGLTLIPAIERTIEGSHVLLINFPAECAGVASFADLAALKARHPGGLVVAPHPWFPMGKSLGGRRLDAHAELWDAIEINAFYTRHVDFNDRAWNWAREHGIPLVGNCDVHQLEQLGTTCSMVDVEEPLTPDAVCAAIKAGRVRIETRPISWRMAFRVARRALLSRFHHRRADSPRDTVVTTSA